MCFVTHVERYKHCLFDGLWGFGGAVTHTHSAIELPLTMTNIETLIGQSLS